MKKLLCFLLMLMLLLPAAFAESADESGEDDVYTIVDASGQRITDYAGIPDIGDEYIAGDNKHFRVTAVDHTQKKATAENLGTYAMPDVSWLDDDSQPVSSVKKAVAMYCTHSDESYTPTDGTSSDEKRGGIYDVAQGLKSALEDKGVTVYLSENTHHPHDAGAYRRSRSTATKLMNEGVDAILDIHRDGIKDPDEYKSDVNGEEMTKVRLLVGKSNQNADTNKQFATQLKAIADKVHPGLVKDIYIGKGSYNQDLMSHAVLLEFGTYTNNKDDVITSTAYMADVLYRALYGGVTGAAGSSDVNMNNNKSGTANINNTTNTKAENSAGWTGIAWVIGIFVVGALVYAFAASGNGKTAVHKWGRTFQEMFGGLFGGKHEDKE